MKNFNNTNFRDSSVYTSECTGEMSFDRAKKYHEKLYPHLAKLEIGKPLEDVILDPNIKDPRCNTNIDVYIGGFDQFNRGYLGQGPHTLARNIIYLFSGGDKDFTDEHYCKFVQEVISKFPETQVSKKIIRLKKESILKWIRKRRGKSKFNIIDGGKA